MAQDAELETGWLATTPAEDTIERAMVLASADRVRHFGAAAGAPVLDDDRVIIAVLGDNAMLNMGHLKRPIDASESAALVASLREVLAGRPACLFSAWPLPRAAVEHGVSIDGHPPLLARWPGQPCDLPALRAGDELVEVTTDEGLDVAERVLVDGYPLPGDASAYVARSGVPHGILGPTRAWLASAGGTPAAVAFGHLAHGVNVVEFVATMEAARGRGLGAQVTWAASTVDPSRPAALVASDLGRPVYERLGYQALTRWTFALLV
jgi:hypothetical protein